MMSVQTSSASELIVPSFSSENSNQMELFYKLKNEIDSINRQLNLQSNLLCLVERRNCFLNRNVETKAIKMTEIERNYRCWRRKLSKLKKERDSSNVNLYDLLYDLYQHLQVCQVKFIAADIRITENVTKLTPVEIESLENIVDLKPKIVVSENGNLVKPKRTTKYVQKIKSKPIQMEQQQQQFFECRFCSYKKAKSKRSLISHMVQVHKEENINFCDIGGCQERFFTSNLLRKHRLECHTNLVECKKCHKFFENQTLLASHQTTMHRIRCTFDGCDKIFPTRRQFRQHIDEHSTNQNDPIPKPKKKTFECPRCSKIFTRESHYKPHLKAVNCTKVWCCHVENCPEMFPKLKFLTEHCLAIHQEPVRFRCTWPGCNKLCNENRRLKLHYRVHTGERPYKCTWPGCDKRFKTVSCVHSHIKLHKNEMKYSCSYSNCSYRANTNCSMRSHIRIKHQKRYYKRDKKKKITDEVNNDQNQTNGMENLTSSSF